MSQKHVKALLAEWEQDLIDWVAVDEVGEAEIELLKDHADELRRAIAEDERNHGIDCENCAHRKKPADTHPCNDCALGQGTGKGLLFEVQDEA